MTSGNYYTNHFKISSLSASLISFMNNKLLITMHDASSMVIQVKIVVLGYWLRTLYHLNECVKVKYSSLYYGNKKERHMVSSSK